MRVKAASFTLAWTSGRGKPKLAADRQPGAADAKSE